MRKGYLSHRRPAKAQVSLRISLFCSQTNSRPSGAPDKRRMSVAQTRTAHANLKHQKPEKQKILFSVPAQLDIHTAAYLLNHNTVLGIEI